MTTASTAFPDDAEQTHGADEPGDDTAGAPVPYTGLSLYDPAREALSR